MLTDRIEAAALGLLAVKEARGQRPSCTPREVLDVAELPTDDQWLEIAERVLKGSVVFKRDPLCCGCNLHFCLGDP